jgi:UDP-4-amino-4,6-dideoxy-N-acetyl-beta-L-altrosamine N-acetyltransferase
MAIRFREPTPADAEMILSWRSKPRVTDYLNTDVDADPAGQRAWLERCRERPDYYHWIVEIGGAPAGLVSIDRLDLDADQASWGFYIGEDQFLNMGGLIPPHLYNWVFFRVGLQRLWAEVLAFNHDVIALHRQHGYALDRLVQGAVQKRGRQFDLQYMQLHRQSWVRQHRYHRFRADFPIADPAPRLAARLAGGAADTAAEDDR